MKTKEEDRMSWIPVWVAQASFSRSAAFRTCTEEPQTLGSRSTLRDRKMREQSRNVYENKRRGQKVDESRLLITLGRWKIVAPDVEVELNRTAVRQGHDPKSKKPSTWCSRSSRGPASHPPQVALSDHHCASSSAAASAGG